MSYLADLSLAEDDHHWQALLQWKTLGAGNGAVRFRPAAPAQPSSWVLVGRLQTAGYTTGSAEYELVVCPWLRPGRGWYRLAGGQHDDTAGAQQR